MFAERIKYDSLFLWLFQYTLLAMITVIHFYKKMLYKLGVHTQIFLKPLPVIQDSELISLVQKQNVQL